MKRWIAQELAHRDGTLVGFWPMACDLVDYGTTAADAYPCDADSTYTPSGGLLASIDAPCLPVTVRGTLWGSGAGSVVISRPADLREDELLIAFVAVDSAGAYLPATPSGWTPLITADAPSAVNMKAFSRKATSSEPSSYTFDLTPSGTEDVLVTLLHLGHANSCDYTSGGTGSASATTAVVPSIAIDTDVYGRLELACWLTDSPSLAITPPASTQEHVQTASATMRMAVASELLTAEGPSGDRTATVAGLAATCGIGLAVRGLAPTGGVRSPDLVTLAGRNCFRFDGKRCLVAGGPNDFSFKATDPFTVSIWFCQTADDSGGPPPLAFRPLIGKVDIVGPVGWMINLGHQPTGFPDVPRVQFTMWGSGGASKAVEADISELVAGNDLYRWHHLVVVYDGTNFLNEVRVFLDGQRLPVADLDSVPIGSTAHDRHLHLGLGLRKLAWDSPIWQWITVTDLAISTTRIYNRVLEENEIVQLYLRELGAPTWKKQVVFNPPTPVSTNAFLFLAGHEPSAAETTLYLYGADIDTLSMPLMVEAGTVPSLLVSGELYISGSANPSAGAYLTLHTTSDTPMIRWIPLSIAVPDSDQVVRSIILFVNGEHKSVRGQCDLVVCNTLLGETTNLPLFLKVDGTLVGGQAHSADMPLFLQRPFEAGVDLYICGPGEVADVSLPLVINCWSTSESSMDLVLPNVVGALPMTTRLYVHGW